MRGSGLTVTTLGDRELVLIRTFGARGPLVFDPLTRPELLQRWYGAQGWNLIEREFILCGIADEPTCPGANPSVASSCPAMRRRVVANDEGPDATCTSADTFVGLRMGEVFRLAEAFIDLPCSEIETLLDSPVHEVRAGALNIMDRRARRRSTTEEQRRELYELYLRRHDRIDSWDLVDLAAPWVIGHYLLDRPRDLLDRLARSEVVSERRTAIKATLHLVRAGDLDEHAAAMPRTMLRYAVEHLDPDTFRHHRSLPRDRRRRGGGASSRSAWPRPRRVRPGGSDLARALSPTNPRE